MRAPGSPRWRRRSIGAKLSSLGRALVVEAVVIAPVIIGMVIPVVVVTVVGVIIAVVIMAMVIMPIVVIGLLDARLGRRSLQRPYAGRAL
jgi:hypothetical protein